MSEQRQSFVKQALSSHSLIGITFGALLFLICFTGALAVFYEEIERWEQPTAEEHNPPSLAAIETTLNQVLQNPELTTEHMYLVFPNEALPRYKIANEREGWYLNSQGELDVPATDHVSHFITGLHNQLTLPENIGIYLVSLLGIILTGMIISGFCAHPNIFKDAFHWRTHRSQQLKEVDTHNRLSVWGAPFYLMMAITGAYFGFSGLLFGAYSSVFYPGTQEELVSEIFGEEPHLTGQASTVNLTKTMAEVKEINPTGKPLFAIVHDGGTENQFVEVFMQHPDRLIYSENYQFDTAGNYLGKAGFSDGETAKQMAYSVYRLHFGHFAGLPIKFLYFILGLALAYVCISGINIWLIKRRYEDWLNKAWTATVWGLPLAITASVFLQIMHWAPATATFWISWLAIIIGGTRLAEPRTVNTYLILANGVMSLILLMGYGLHHEFVFWGAGTINTVLLLWAAITLYLGISRLKQPTVEEQQLVAGEAG